MKMEDLLMPARAPNSKKDDSVSPDDDAAAPKPVTEAGTVPNSPTADAEEDMGTSTAPAVDVDGLRDELKLAGTGQPLVRIPAVGLLFADTLYGAPTLLPELVNRWGAVHQILVILTVRQVMPRASTQSCQQSCTLVIRCQLGLCCHEWCVTSHVCRTVCTPPTGGRAVTANV